MEYAVKNEYHSAVQLKYDERNKEKTLSVRTCERQTGETSRENKPSEVSFVLDAYCKTNTFDDSSDFIRCDVKQKTNKTEISCEICKEIITHLDVHDREMHVNNCIDKQSSCNSESESIFIAECPLCFKQFSSTELRTSHIKKCGKSKGLSTQSVLRALELQERHALERRSLGLPAKPLRLVKSLKNPVHKKAVVEPKSKVHSDIQLAKALSLSLATLVQKEEKSIRLKPPTIHDRPGKASSLSVTPLLVLRTEEERKKLLLDKVATIITPMDELESDGEYKEKERNVDLSISLLWCLSSKASETSHYYIEDLFDWIRPPDVEVGPKLRHLSQIPGHEIVTQLPCDYTFSSPESRGDKTSVDSGASSVIECLRSLVASSWMSDVDIHTSCGTVVPAHRLLLAARCPALKRDPDVCERNGKLTLKWETVSFDAALQFLNFVYTGNIDVKDNMTTELSQLANKYEVSDLQALLHTTDISTDSSEVESEERTLLNDDKVLVSCCKSQDIIPDSQGKNNVDLNIVYNCISSSMAPSQLSGSDSLRPKPAKSRKIDFGQNSVISTGVNDEMGKWQERVQKDSCPIVDIHHDVENDSYDAGNLECFASFSRKATVQSDQDTEVLDLCSAGSNDSQDSIKILESSFAPSCFSHPVFGNDIFSPPRSLQNVSKKSPDKMNDLTSAPHISPHLKISPELECSHSEIHHFPPSNEIQTLDALETNGEPLSPSDGEVEEFKMGSVRFISPGKSESIACDNLTFGVACEDDKSETSKDFLSFENNVSSVRKPPAGSATSLECRNHSEFQRDFSHIALPPNHNIPSTKSRNRGLLNLQKTFLECQNEYPGTPSKILDTDSGGRSVTELTHCYTGEETSSTVNKPAEDETISCVAKLNVKDIYEKPVFSPQLPDDPHEYLQRVQENSEMATLHIRKATTSADSAGFQLSDSPVTPLPDYKAMMTPEIKQALRKIGVKALPRRKAIQLLSHVYDETHPLTHKETKEMNCSRVLSSKEINKSKKRKILNENTERPSKKRQKEIPEISQESDDNNSDNPEWNGCVPEISFSQFQEDSPTKESKDEIQSIKHYVQSNEGLYSNILIYKPLNLMEFHQELKDNGIKISIQKLTDFLDEQCITFTCPRKEEYQKKQTARTQRFRRNMIAKFSQLK